MISRPSIASSEALTSRGSDMRGKVLTGPGLYQRPITRWLKVLSDKLGMRPQAVRSQLPVWRHRVEEAIDAMVRTGAADLAGDMMTGFEARFIQTQNATWTGAHRIASQKDASQNVAAVSLLLDQDCPRTADDYDRHLTAEITAKMDELRALRRMRDALRAGA